MSTKERISGWKEKRSLVSASKMNFEEVYDQTQLLFDFTKRIHQSGAWLFYRRASLCVGKLRDKII